MNLLSLFLNDLWLKEKKFFVVSRRFAAVFGCFLMSVNNCTELFIGKFGI